MDKFIAGVCVGLVSFAVLLSTVEGSLVKQASDAKTECEKSLPRDQHCRIVAVPVDKD